MEMSPLHPEGQSESAEPGPSHQRPSYKDDQVWKDIEAETGFASCADYMEFYKDIRPDFTARLNQYGAMQKGQDNMTELSIHDLSKQEDSAECLRFRRHCRSGTELIRRLRDPPGDVCVQIVLWKQFFFPQLFQEMADAVVLGLKLDPQILEDLDRLWKDEEDYRTTGFRTSHVQRLVGHGTIATLSQNFITQSVKAVPVLLIATSNRIVGATGHKLAQAFAGGGRWMPPFSRSTSVHQKISEAQLYAKTVEEFIAQSRFAIPTEAFLLLAAASPLLYNEADQVQKALMDVQSTYHELMRRKLDHPSLSDMEHKDLTGNLDIQRLVLRHTLEKGEDHGKQFFRYLCSEIDTDWSKEPSYVNIEADWKSLIEAARRLETEVRDYMQIQVGNLSLEESRRSIELSNIQIRESQSGQQYSNLCRLTLILYSKNLSVQQDILLPTQGTNDSIVTILAFVYVPLNLATSIFGMNIQQLNQNGQNIWVFFMTAVVALLVTGGSWVLSNAVYKAMSWYKQLAARIVKDDKEDEKREYDFPHRVAMLVWLVRNGHTAWMWTTGAWLAILMDSKAKSKVSVMTSKHEFIDYTACDYVWDINSPKPSRCWDNKWHTYLRWFPISE